MKCEWAYKSYFIKMNNLAGHLKVQGEIDFLARDTPEWELDRWSAPTLHAPGRWGSAVLWSVSPVRRFGAYWIGYDAWIDSDNPPALQSPDLASRVALSGWIADAVEGNFAGWQNLSHFSSQPVLPAEAPVLRGFAAWATSAWEASNVAWSLWSLSPLWRLDFQRYLRLHPKDINLTTVKRLSVLVSLFSLLKY